MLAYAPPIVWSLSPGALISAAVVGGAYVHRWLTVRRSPSPRAAHDAPVWRLACFLGGMLAGLVALVSPIDTLADHLFFVHMVQHILLLDIAPILAILGLTKVILRPITRAIQDVEHRAGWFAGPVFAALLYIGVIWVWHIPAAYDFAVSHAPIHVMEHMSFLIAGSLYWWHLISPIRSRQRLTGLGPIVYMGSTKVCVGVLGMALAFAPVALYPYYVHQNHPFGISPLTDQALAGIIMAVEQSIVMGIALVWLFIRALGESERAEQRRERLEAAA